MTPDEYIDANFPRPETRPAAKLCWSDDMTSTGQAVIDHDEGRGTFWPSDMAAPDLPIIEAILHICGQKVDVINVDKCPAKSTNHWHFSIKRITDSNQPFHPTGHKVSRE